MKCAFGHKGGIELVTLSEGDFVQLGSFVVSCWQRRKIIGVFSRGKTAHCTSAEYTFGNIETKTALLQYSLSWGVGRIKECMLV